MRITHVLRALALAAAAAAAPVASAEPAADWLYFDLGEVIVTGNPTDGYTYVPGAIEYLKQMRADGYKLALVSNIPQSWGALCSQKYSMLQEFLGTRLHETEPMDWTLFDRVILPPYDRYRKDVSPLMFISALHTACPGRAAYMGEVPSEIATAKARGFATFLKDDVSTPLPAGQSLLQLLDADFTFQQPEGCDFNALYDAAMLPQDQGQQIRACVLTP